MKNLLISLLVITVVCLCVVPASATSLDDSSNNIVKIPYIMKPWIGFTGNEEVLAQSGAVVNGETDSYYYGIPSSVVRLYFSLEWGNTANLLTLTLIAPNGQVLGTFDDSYDGVINGIIPVEVTFSGSNPGQWNARVNGYSVSGSQNYNLYMSAST